MNKRLIVGGVMVLLALAVPADAALTGLWRFDGDFADSSGAGNHGAETGGVSFTTGIFGQSGSFSGSSRVEVPHSATLDAPSAVTIAAWVQPQGDVGWDGIVAKNPSNGSAINHAGNYELRIDRTAENRQPNLLYQRGGVNDTIGVVGPGGLIPDGQWTHLAVTADGSTATFYINGTPVASPAMPAGFGATNTNSLFIGNRADLTTTPFNGLLDDVAVFNTALSQTDIQTIITGDFSGFLPPPPPPPPPADLLTGVGVLHVSSELIQNFARDADRLVDGSGLDPATGAHTIVPDGNMWLSTGTTNCCGGVSNVNNPGPGQDAQPSLTFDLHGVYDLNTIKVWNYNEGIPDLTARGANQVIISVAENPGDPFVPIAGVNLTEAPGVGDVDFGQIIALGAANRARYVKVDFLSGHGGDNGFIGLSEIQFNGDLVGPDQILGVTATASSELVNPFNRGVGNIVDNVGLSTTIPDGNPGQEAGMWLSRGTFAAPFDTDPEVTFDLGAVERLAEMIVYNYNETTAGLFTRGVNEVEVLVSTDGVDFTSLGNFNFDIADGTPFLNGQLIDLGGVSAQFVRFDILSNHGGDNNFVGLNEVQFFRLGPVPEPASGLLALMGGAALMARRRRAA